MRSWECCLFGSSKLSGQWIWTFPMYVCTYVQVLNRCMQNMCQCNTAYLPSKRNAELQRHPSIQLTKLQCTEYMQWHCNDKSSHNTWRIIKRQLLNSCLPNEVWLRRLRLMYDGCSKWHVLTRTDHFHTKAHKISALVHKLMMIHYHIPYHC